MTYPHRDLASREIWERSLERSRHRRQAGPALRRQANRRKHASAVVTAAMLTGPSAQALAASGGSGGASPRAGGQSPAAVEARAVLYRLGSAGPIVAEIQGRLRIEADGLFGARTDAAVRDFQRRNGLAVDGIVGPRTWMALFAGAVRAAANTRKLERPAGAERQQAPRDAELVVLRGREGDGGEGDGVEGDGGVGGAESEAPRGVAQESPSAPVVLSCGSSRVTSPVDGVVTSEFGPRGGRNHDGVDIAAPTGTPVRSAACGVVTLRGAQSGYGNIVCVAHTDSFTTCYAHLSRFSTRRGEEVRQGETIGYVGCTGRCTGPHLHFETRVNGRAQDPEPYMNGDRRIPGAEHQPEQQREPDAPNPGAEGAQAQPEAQGQPGPQAQAQPRPEPQPEPQPQTESQPKPQAQPEPAAQSQTAESAPEQRVQPAAQTRVTATSAVAPQQAATVDPEANDGEPAQPIAPAA